VAGEKNDGEEKGRKERKGHRGHIGTLFSTHSVSLERSQ